MKQVLAFILVLLPLITIAQIRVVSQTERQKPPVPKAVAYAYDSISNVPSKLQGFLGQELFLMPKPESLRPFGYSCFSDEHGDPVVMAHDDICGHTFFVEDVVDNNKLKSLRLRDEKTGSIYFVDASKASTTWPFLTLGFKSKYEAENKGKEFYFTEAPETDFITGADIKAGENTLWTFQEIIICDNIGDIGYLFNNSQGETAMLTRYDIGDIITKKSVDDNNERIKNLKKKYGASMVNSALEGKIMIGMPKGLVILAWGEPDKINRASYGDQWVYGSSYIKCVYFENGKVTGWN